MTMALRGWHLGKRPARRLGELAAREHSRAQRGSRAYVPEEIPAEELAALTWDRSRFLRRSPQRRSPRYVGPQPVPEQIAVLTCLALGRTGLDRIASPEKPCEVRILPPNAALACSGKTLLGTRAGELFSLVQRCVGDAEVQSPRGGSLVDAPGRGCP